MRRKNKMKCICCDKEIKGTHFESEYGSYMCFECGDEILELDNDDNLIDPDCYEKEIWEKVKEE
jgi:predicted RNA-binding Zn-ribbon protein involved in translation (DUF1610 family)